MKTLVSAEMTPVILPERYQGDATVENDRQRGRQKTQPSSPCP